MNENVLKLAAYVVMSSYRTKALTVLAVNEVMIPKYIAKECNIRSNHISLTLRELKEHGLCVCVNPEARKGRLYKITGLGEKVYRVLPLLKGE